MTDQNCSSRHTTSPSSDSDDDGFSHSSRDKSPKRKRKMSSPEFHVCLTTCTAFSTVQDVRIGIHDFFVSNCATWTLYKTVYEDYPEEYKENSKTGQIRPVFEILADALLLKNQEDLAFNVIVANNVDLCGIVIGLFANGSLSFYNKLLLECSVEEAAKLDKKMKKQFPVPIFNMELYNHFQCWENNVDYWIKESKGDCEWLGLVFNMWNCFTFKSTLYCDFLMEKLEQKTPTGEMAYAGTFVQSTSGYCRRWGYAYSEAESWGHEKALGLCEKITEYSKNFKWKN
jgi:hypothetical protein